MVSSTARPALSGTLLLALALAGCTSGSPASSTGPGAVSRPTPAVDTTAPPTTVGATVKPSVAAGATVTPAPASTRGPASPPVALLEVAVGHLVEGELGSYTWQDGGSDAPWIVVPAAGAVQQTGPYRIVLQPVLEPVTWTAAWAPIDHGRPGTIAGYEQGTGGGIAFAGPAGAGPWSLRLEIDFGHTRRATWYWRLVSRR